MEHFVRWLADAVVLFHIGFVLFVCAGGLLALRWRWMLWLHVPAVVWGATIEFAGWICPLTPIEVALRRRAGEAGYEGGFVEHYILPVLYPAGLNRDIQFALGLTVVGLNVVVYGLVLARWRAKRSVERAS